MEKSMKTPFILVVLLLSLGLMTIGCEWLPFGDDQTKTGQDQEALSVSTTGEKLGENAEIIIGESQSNVEMIAVELYFMDAASQKLVKEKREIPKTVGMARATLEELFKGAADTGSGLASAIPLGTSLLDINVRTDGKCIVDLSREFISNLGKDPQTETLAVYAVVNTLTQYPTVTEVQVLVDGQIVNSPRGEVDLSQPLTRSESIIKN